MKLFAYIALLSWRTFRGILLSYRTLGALGYPSSVYFNVALMVPMFLDYRDLVGTINPKAPKDTPGRRTGKTLELKSAVKASALMLLEDILLDEENIDPARLEELFDLENIHKTEPSPELNSDLKPASKIEAQTRALLKTLEKELAPGQMTLLKQLNLAQVANDFEAKGLWFPALVFSFNPEMSVPETKALRLLGFWIKCVDDLVDLEDDRQSGQQTALTTLDPKIPAKQYLEGLRLRVFAGIRRLKYPEQKLARFLYRISVATYAFKLHNEMLKKMPDWYRRLCRIVL